MASQSSLLGLSSLENGELDSSFFELMDYLMLDIELSEEQVLPPPKYQESSPLRQVNSNGTSVSICSSGKCMQKNSNNARRARIAFKTKSDKEILDDGYKWRKYGKKKVKNSPNPRNYYRCSSEGCHVKKRVERMREDSSYVITTYEGIHSHLAPKQFTYSSLSDGCSSSTFP